MALSSRLSHKGSNDYIRVSDALDDPRNCPTAGYSLLSESTEVRGHNFGESKIMSDSADDFVFRIRINMDVQPRISYGLRPPAEIASSTLVTK
ncbi:hypothetical protein LB507_000329 [Fusarium sp. FIESC RH6]|nr:hypothetical protein LB507_000329 [Fusarium sp. FIESC RH6]